MSGGATAAYVAAAVASTYVAYQNGQDQKKAAERAAQQAEVNAKKQEKAAEEATNQANQKRPNTKAILDSAQLSGKGGISGTMLTGPQGVDPNSLSLGKTTLLGQ